MFAKIINLYKIWDNIGNIV